MGRLVDPAVGWVALGVVGALAFLALGRRRAERERRRVWWIGLVVAALVYVAFVIARSGPLIAVAFEAGGAVAFGALGALGLRGDRRWLAAAWLLHPVWDLGLHGPGGFALAPAGYVWACLGFDLVVGGALWAPPRADLE